MLIVIEITVYLLFFFSSIVDNLVNQKVLTRYLTRVGLNVDIAVHGGECIDLFFKYPRDHYSLILCDLFMPVKGKRSFFFIKMNLNLTKNMNA